MKFKVIAQPIENTTTKSADIISFLSPHIKVLGKFNVQAIREFCEQNEGITVLDNLLAILPQSNFLSTEQKHPIREYFANLQVF